MDECKTLARGGGGGGGCGPGVDPRNAHTGAHRWGWGGGRGLHSSTFQLNVSTFCRICWVHYSPPVYYTGGHGEV